MGIGTGLAVGGLLGILIISVVGLVVGAIAKLLMPGDDPGGWFMTILLGIAGSWVGQVVLHLLGAGGRVPGFIAAVGGAMLLLLAHRLLAKHKPRA